MFSVDLLSYENLKLVEIMTSFLSTNKATKFTFAFANRYTGEEFIIYSNYKTNGNYVKRYSNGIYTGFPKIL